MAKKAKRKKKGREVIGIIEEVIIKGTKKKKKLKAKIDTGAYRSSICKSLLTEIGMPKIIKKVTVKNPITKEIRPLIELKVKVDDKWIKSRFTIALRKEMRYSILIGQNTLKKLNVLIDPKIKKDN